MKISINPLRLQKTARQWPAVLPVSALCVMAIGLSPVSASAQKVNPVIAANNVLDVYSLERKEFLQNYPTGKDPCKPGVSADGSMVCVPNNTDETVTVFSVNGSARPVTIPVGDNPIQAAFTPDGKHIYVTLADNGAAVIDLSSQSVTPISFADGGYNLAMAPDGNTVYVTSETASEVAAIAVNENNTVTMIPVPGTAGYLYALELDPEGQYLDICDAVSPGQILTIRTKDNTVVNETTTVGNGPVGLAIKGKRGYSANNGNGTVSVFKVM